MTLAYSANLIESEATLAQSGLGSASLAIRDGSTRLATSTFEDGRHGHTQSSMGLSHAGKISNTPVTCGNTDIPFFIPHNVKMIWNILKAVLDGIHLSTR